MPCEQMQLSTHLLAAQACGGNEGNAVAAAERALPVAGCYATTLVSHHVAPAGRSRSRQGFSLQVHGVQRQFNEFETASSI